MGFPIALSSECLTQQFQKFIDTSAWIQIQAGLLQMRLGRLSNNPQGSNNYHQLDKVLPIPANVARVEAKIAYAETETKEKIETIRTTFHQTMEEVGKSDKGTGSHAPRK